jgi:NADP-dependent 3-hydroxy acid dehydrogenase YdfG
MSDPKKTAVVTGASAGIGAATARALHREGFRLVLGARRVERLEELARELGGPGSAGSGSVKFHALDVTDPASVRKFASSIERADLLVNNAGAAFGLDRVESAVEERWREMFELNVMGVLRVTRALLPRLRASGDGHIINVGSISGFEVYPGGAGYTASKHAARALTKTLRLELLGEPIRITEIAPGLADTEFGKVRFAGDTERADRVYRGMTPLVAEDVAECIAFAATRPSHVNIDELVVKPRDQAHSTAVHRHDS